MCESICLVGKGVFATMLLPFIRQRIIAKVQNLTLSTQVSMHVIARRLLPPGQVKREYLPFWQIPEAVVWQNRDVEVQSAR